jgi:hypothetical protein
MLGSGSRRLGGGMRKFVVVLFAAILLSGCGSLPDQQRNTLIGTGVGAGIGALVGSATGGGPGAIAVGAAIGGAAGGIIGYYAGPDHCYFRNQRGEIWQVPCEDLRVRAKACFVGRQPGGLKEVDCPWDHRGV